VIWPDTAPKLIEVPLIVPVTVPLVRHGVPLTVIVPARSEPVCVQVTTNVPLDVSGEVSVQVPLHWPLRPSGVGVARAVGVVSGEGDVVGALVGALVGTEVAGSTTAVGGGVVAGEGVAADVPQAATATARIARPARWNTRSFIVRPSNGCVGQFSYPPGRPAQEGPCLGTADLAGATWTPTSRRLTHETATRRPVKRAMMSA
jgi:hypothetical protein